MRKIMKRGFCLFLVAVLLAGLVPYAFADEAKPTDVSEDAAEPTEETTAPPETTVPSESTEPPSEPTEPTATTEATEPEADPVEDDTEDDRLLPDNISTYASTVSNVLLFDQASPNYTTVLSSQISVTYQPNGTDTAKTAYIKNLGWHFARYNNTPYEDDPIYCIEPCKNYAASTSGNYMDQDLGVSGSGSSRGSNVWYAMPSSYRQAIALTLLYSKQLWNSNYSAKTTAMANNPNVSTRIATQFLIYEIVTGLRDASTFNRKSSNGYSSGDVFYNAGDTMEYQIISTLPTITSQATALSTYNFYDTLCEGLAYDKDAGVTVAFFTDAACTDKVATWSQDSGKFTVTYSEDGRHMTVDITKAGLDEINGSTANKNGKLYTGYSNYTARVTYSAVINSDNSFAYGEKGNENTVILSWKRTSGDYYDTLIDDCHVFSFGLDLTKLFSDVDAETAAETKLYDSVKFKIQNKTDGIWIIAKRNDAEGVYYVTGHTDKETDATVFTPVTMGKAYGHIMVKGLEEDTYTITETQTANGYTLLKNAITVTISLKENTANTCNVYAKDVLGVLQNDPHYSFDGGEDLKLTNIPQRALSHNYPTVSATVDKNDVTMLEDNGSANAEVPLTVKNTKGFDLPKTGDHGTWMYSLVGILLMSTAAGVIVLTVKKKHGR